MSVAVQIWIRDPVCHQSLIICSLAHENFMQINLEVLRKVVNKQTDKQRRLHILLGGGNKRTKH